MSGSKLGSFDQNDMQLLDNVSSKFFISIQTKQWKHSAVVRLEIEIICISSGFYSYYSLYSGQIDSVPYTPIFDFALRWDGQFNRSLTIL